ncbi:Pls/PosA family non-ribosomal peptide synthetase [Citricoccus sp.]|uniref:Pls/PosA family non-ribosomal peptide synthetase n=1 Tax=Citricoccus sp. TaxID=1978372 RepID=UPI0028BEAC64|nr:Pls/PosA family non-ribosomal peptide synthetase [Citricoccus sp.]
MPSICTAESVGKLAIYPHRPATSPRTLVDILQSTIADHPGSPAIDDGHALLTYADLGTQTDAMARRLWSMDIGVGDRIGIRVPSGSADLYIAILGVLVAGAAYVPVDADEPDERAETVWTESAVCAVISEGLTITARSGVPSQGNNPDPHPNDDAWIIFTSGSTGKPKGVAISHRSAAAWADAESEMFLQNAPLTPGDRVLAGLSVAFDASCEEMWLAWRSGACLVPAPRSLVRSGADLGDWLAHREITVVSTVPTLAAMWPQEALDNIRLLIFGGEALPADLVSRLANPSREVWNTYGPTEATVIACGAVLDGTGPVSIGLPLRGWELAVVDSDGAPVAWGETGELIIGGVGLGRYLDPEKDAEKYGPMPSLGWDRAYRSGDLVVADPDGLFFIGRADEQVKLGGRRVELGEIDSVLGRLDGVAAAAVAVQATPSGNKILAGYLLPKLGNTLDLRALRRRLSEELPAQLVPALVVMDELPLKTSGKVDRKALPWPVAASHGEAGPQLSGTEGWISGLWTELLGPVPLDGKSDFFELGGASLAAAQLVGRLRMQYPDVSIADIYDYPALGDLATRLDGLEPSGVETHEVLPTPWWTGVFQAPVIAGLYIITGLRYVTGMALISWALSTFTSVASWVPDPPLLPIVVAWVVLFSLPSRILFAVGSARLLTLGISPGTYQRGGWAHLRLWAAERVVTFGKLEPIMGTPLGIRYARMLGNTIGQGVYLGSMPPVTGLMTVGNVASIEYETDLHGHWLDGDSVHVGALRVGEHARVGTRSVLMDRAWIGDYAEIEPGTVVSGRVPAGERWAGSQMECVGQAGEESPKMLRVRTSRTSVALLYPLSLIGLTILPMISAVPGALILLPVVQDIIPMTEMLLTLAAWAPVFLLVTVITYLSLVAGAVRLLARKIVPGKHFLHSATGWAVWLSNQLLAKTLVAVYPLYASVLTPLWMRVLGAQVGKHVEISTLETIPHLTTLRDSSFMADHSLGSFPLIKGGRLYVGKAVVGTKSFAGNSGIIGPERSIPDNSLVAVLSSAPPDMPANSNFFGNPAKELPRPVDNATTELTFDPPKRLITARAAVEVFRFLPILVTGWMALATVWIIAQIFYNSGLPAALLLAGPVMLASSTVACLIALVAKWALVGRFHPEKHALWTSFVWRNELADVFSESLAVPGLVRMSLGTPMLNVWMRLMGAKVGRRVWLETWWLPEFDLIEIGDGVSINRGTVLQTHLFHDRIMRLDRVRMSDYSTLGPNSILLPGATVESHATIGPASLVMAHETVPANGRWAGNPIGRWDRKWTPDGSSSEAEPVATVPERQRGVAR